MLIVAVFHCKVHNYLILLNRQRIDVTRPADPWSSFSTASTQSMPVDAFMAESFATRGRSQVIQSCVTLLNAFEYFYRHLSGLLMEWLIGQQAFNACMILLLDMHETQQPTHLTLVETGLCIFRDLREKEVHQIAKLAESKISYEYMRLLKSCQEKWNTVGRRQHLAVPGDDPRRDSSSACSTTSQASYVEHKQVPGKPDDTVMGNTGMFLLEDSGLLAASKRTFTVTEEGDPVPPHVSSAHAYPSPAPQQPIVVPSPMTTFPGAQDMQHNQKTPIFLPANTQPHHNIFQHYHNVHTPPPTLDHPHHMPVQYLAGTAYFPHNSMMHHFEPMAETNDMQHHALRHSHSLGHIIHFAQQQQQQGQHAHNNNNDNNVSPASFDYHHLRQEPFWHELG